MTLDDIERQLPVIPDAVGNYANCVRTGHSFQLTGARHPLVSGRPCVVLLEYRHDGDESGG
jgi:hypothetical protein